MAELTHLKYNSKTFSSKVLQRHDFFGTIENLPSAIYHAKDSYISSTAIKYMSANSPEHFKAKYIDETIQRTEPTKDMILGSAVHSLTLTPETFADEFYVLPAGLDRRTKIGKDKYAECIELAGSRQLIDADQKDIANHMSTNVLNNKQAYKLLEKSTNEKSFYWWCPFTSLLFKARIDALRDNYSVELKTTGCISPTAFSTKVDKLNYDLSLVHYNEGLNNAVGVEARENYFICVESEAPFTVQCYKVSEEMLEVGHQKWLDAVQKIEAGIKQNIWPGYVNAAIEEYPPIYPPPWVMNKFMKQETKTEDEIKGSEYGV